MKYCKRTVSEDRGRKVTMSCPGAFRRRGYRDYCFAGASGLEMAEGSDPLSSTGRVVQVAQCSQSSRLMRNSDCRLLKKTQRRGARKIDEGRRGHRVRWSETIERNDTYEVF
jgi:hypothetical protein